MKQENLTVFNFLYFVKNVGKISEAEVSCCLVQCYFSKKRWIGQQDFVRSLLKLVLRMRLCCHNTKPRIIAGHLKIKVTSISILFTARNWLFDVEPHLLVLLAHTSVKPAKGQQLLLHSFILFIIDHISALIFSFSHILYILYFEFFPLVICICTNSYTSV